MTPRQIIAEKLPTSPLASFAATAGISNAPGTRTTLTFAPPRFSSAVAALNIASTYFALYFEATMAKEPPEPRVDFFVMGFNIQGSGSNPRFRDSRFRLGPAHTSEKLPRNIKSPFCLLRCDGFGEKVPTQRTPFERDAFPKLANDLRTLGFRFCQL